ncbi:MAG: hypothetical protein ACK5P1_04050 [Sphingobacteriia bacterium]
MAMGIFLGLALCPMRPVQAQTLKNWAPLTDSLPEALAKAARRQKGKPLEGLAGRLLDSWQQLGYLEAQIDSLMVPDSTGRRVMLLARPGPRYWLDSLEVLGADPGLIREADLDKPGPYRPQLLQLRLDALLALYQQLGYPFARVELRTLHYQPTAQGRQPGYNVRPQYVLHPGKRYYISEIEIVGNIRERPQLVHNLIRLRPGDVLARDRVEQIPILMDNRIYFQNTQAPRIFYSPDSARLRIETTARKANRFEAVVGFLPPREEGERLQWTGSGNFRLVSPFRAGEVISLKLELLPDQSQNLDFSFRYPYLLGTPLSGAFGFSLLRRDTTFLNRTLSLEGSYQFTPYLTGLFTYRRFVSRLLSTTAFRRVVWPPPPNLDSDNTLYGVGFRYTRIDYLLNPRKGYELGSDLAVGTKEFGRPAGLDSLDVTRLLERQPRQELRLFATAYLPMQAFTWVLGARYFWLGLEEYYQNDLSFIGGASSLRGFNENQFLVSQYLLGNVELRLRLSRDAYMGLFAEGGYMERTVLDDRTPIQPIATGLAFSLPTPAGQLLLSYAVGTLPGLPFAPDRGRVHLGLAAQF